MSGGPIVEGLPSPYGRRADETVTYGVVVRHFPSGQWRAAVFPTPGWAAEWHGDGIVDPQDPDRLRETVAEMLHAACWDVTGDWSTWAGGAHRATVARRAVGRAVVPAPNF